MRGDAGVVTWPRNSAIRQDRRGRRPGASVRTGGRPEMSKLGGAGSRGRPHRLHVRVNVLSAQDRLRHGQGRTHIQVRDTNTMELFTCNVI